MKNIIELYDTASQSKQNRKLKVAKAVFYAFVFVALIFCVILFLLTDVSNEKTMRRIVIIVSGVAGCAAIYFYSFAVIDVKHSAEHAKRMISGEREKLVGTFVIGEKDIKIPGSIIIRPMRVQTDGGEQRINVSAEKVPLLPRDGGRYVLYTVNGYLAAIGVENENG